MAYQALYRTWRPQKFSDMIGQEVVTKTLKNAIITGQMSHAYLFNGPRGTGKTSAAKIFAKAVNCLHPIDGEPDGTCEICQSADAGTLGDIIELDAASNNGVDEIREIREDVNYAPTQATYKVYIIDEVHMLSTGAFNALLKTLEEPPANVIFILATTEPQKIPATIISRTQRFDFKRIDAKASYQRMVYILTERGNQYDEMALRVIANAADGGMRDALSILDQALSFGDGAVTLENALLVTGSVTQSLLGEYLEAAVQHDTPLALAKLSEVLSAGKDANRFVEDLISYARDLLLSTEAPDLITLVPDNHFNTLSKEQSAMTWYQMIDVLNETQQQLRFTNRPSIYLEVLTVKLSRPVESKKSLQERAMDSSNQSIVDSTAQVKNDVNTTPIAVSTTKSVRIAPKVGTDEAAVFNVLTTATRGDLNRIQAIWADLINMLPVPQQAMLNVAQPVAASPDGVVISFDFDVIRGNAIRNADLLVFITQQMQTLTQSDQERQLVLITSDEWTQFRAIFVAQRTQKVAVQQPIEEVVEIPEQSESEAVDPLIVEAEKLFGSDLIETEDN